MPPGHQSTAKLVEIIVVMESILARKTKLISKVLHQHTMERDDLEFTKTNYLFVEIVVVMEPVMARKTKFISKLLHQHTMEREQIGKWNRSKSLGISIPFQP